MNETNPALRLQHSTLWKLYVNYFQDAHYPSYSDLLQSLVLTEAELDRVLCDLRMHEWIRQELPRNYAITFCGVAQVERGGWADSRILVGHNELRLRLLNTLRNHQVNGSGVDVEAICSELATDVRKAVRHLGVLIAEGNVDSIGDGLYRLLPKGLDRLESFEVADAIRRDFGIISGLQPQNRGLDFQRIIARVFSAQGWHVCEGQRASHEDADVVAAKGGCIYLLECKWLKERVGADVIGLLTSKLQHRPQARGLVVSMSGFTSGAIEAAEESVAGPVLLMDGDEVRRVIMDEVLLADLLQRKEIVYVATRHAHMATYPWDACAGL